MVVMDQMAKLVDNNVIHHPIGSEHDQPVKFQLAFGGTATPAGFKGFEVHAGRFDTCDGCVARYLCAQFLFDPQTLGWQQLVNSFGTDTDRYNHRDRTFLDAYIRGLTVVKQAGWSGHLAQKIEAESL